MSDYRWSVHGRVVKAVNFKLLVLNHCWFESCQRLWILSWEESIQLVYGKSVVLLGYSLVPEIMHEGTPNVFLYQ